MTRSGESASIPSGTGVHRVGRAATLLIVIQFAVCAAVTCGEEVIPRELHAWGRFEPGATKTERTTAQSFGLAGDVEAASTTERRTTLVAVDEESYTLRVETTIEAAGKTVNSETTITRGYDDQERSSDGQGEHRLIAAGTAASVIDLQSHPCNVYESISTDQVERRVSRLFYGAQPPNLLKVETTHVPLAGGAPSLTSYDVFSLDMPWRVGAETYAGAHVRIVRRHPKGSVVTWSIVVPDLPGGVVSSSSKELDASGRLLNRSTLELIDYDVPGDAGE